MTLSEMDEYTHTPSAHPLWRESHYFNFYDGKLDVGGFTTIGIMPNKHLVEVGIVIVRKNKLIYAHPFEGILEWGWDDLCFGGVSFKPIKPMKIWKIKFRDEDIKIDLIFEGINPVFDYGDNLGALTELVGTRHYQHSGTVKGTIAMGNEKIVFSGYGERDHSWGIRNWHGCERWTWFTVQFGADLALNCWLAVIENREFVRGYVYDGRRNLPIESINIQTVFEDDKKTQKSMNFELTDSSGRTFSLDAKALIVIPVLKVSPGHTTIINEALSQFKYNSRTGFGVTEYLWTKKCL